VNWRIEWTPRALKELALLDREQQSRVRAAIEALASDAGGDVKRLRGITPPEYRLRAGKWRVRFHFGHQTGTITILHVLRRDEAY
jgi:mRNA interferase RelE/StbE